ncbi:plasmid replication protein RepC [Methylocystis sp. IM4]|uniref:plasmid replication protein RepC n=1 Tax=Methylocystis sp. IM4 TaxID=3136560 RepID=UPI00311961CC
MAPTTLRRHLAALVASGLIIRRDSPNGKRYARKGQGGEIEYAFGFDLTPLIARAAEIENLADEVRAEKKAVALLRERVTLLRRDIAKMIEVALEERVPGDWQDRHLQYQQLSSRYGRNLLRAELGELAHALSGLLTEIQITLENHIKQEKVAGNDSQFGRHIQNQITDNPDIEPCLREGGAEPLRPKDQNPEAATAVDVKTPRAPKAYPLGMVLEACPDILDFAKGGIASWGDFTSTAALVRPALGISPDAWRQAAEAMGEIDAAIVVAAILQRGDEIKSAGGYLRVLTGKAGAGGFSIGPVLMALIRGRKGKIDRRRA